MKRLHGLPTPALILALIITLAPVPATGAEPPTEPAAAEAVPPAKPAAPGADPDEATPVLLLESPYPLEVAISFPAGLLHWLDSLAGAGAGGMTGGKTIPAHREQYARLYGDLAQPDAEILRGFVTARTWSVSNSDRSNPQALTEAFLDARNLDDALGRSKKLLDDGRFAGFRKAIEHFEPKYRPVWQEGRIQRKFVDRVALDESRGAVTEFLAGVATFYGVSPGEGPAARIVLVPVPRGYGTHAQAIGRNVLLEIRPGDGLPEQVGPLVHENAHVLFYRMDASKRDALRDRAENQGETGKQAWGVLLESLPTAIGQGVAERKFGVGSWSRDSNWYAVAAVDRYAKDLYLLVRRTLKSGGTFDETFLDGALAVHGTATDVTPRSP
jgi:hypothetical protein